MAKFGFIAAAQLQLTIYYNGRIWAAAKLAYKSQTRDVLWTNESFPSMAGPCFYGATAWQLRTTRTDRRCW